MGLAWILQRVFRAYGPVGDEIVSYSDATNGRRSGRLTSEHGTLLIVEPVRLLRWSLSRYLSQWFDVKAVATVQDAEQVFASGDVDAVVLSDALPGEGAQRVEMQAKQMKKCSRIVRMVTQPVSDLLQDSCIQHIEKPFELFEIRKLLLHEMPLSSKE